MRKAETMWGTCGSCRIEKQKCRECRACGSKCDNPNYEEVGFLINAIEDFIVALCEQEREFEKNMGYVFGICDFDPSKCKSDTKKLLAYRRVLKRLWDALVMGGDESCLCDNNYQTLREKVLSLIGVCRNEDSSHTVKRLDNDWLLNNPGMTTFERWERALYEAKPDFKVRVTPVEMEVSKLVFDVVAIKEKKPEVAIEILAKNPKTKKSLIKVALKHDIVLNDVKIESELVAADRRPKIEVTPIKSKRKPKVGVSPIKNKKTLGAEVVPEQSGIDIKADVVPEVSKKKEVVLGITEAKTVKENKIVVTEAADCPAVEPDK